MSRIIVSFKLNGQVVYLKWVNFGMYHIVRDISEATLYSESRARQLQKRFAHKGAILIRRKEK